MKLLYCNTCHDVVKISSIEIRSCHCGGCSGLYIDERSVQVVGECDVLGIDNLSIRKAQLVKFTTRMILNDEYLQVNNNEKGGINFKAFIIPDGNKWVQRVEVLQIKRKNER